MTKYVDKFVIEDESILVRDSETNAKTNVITNDINNNIKPSIANLNSSMAAVNGDIDNLEERVGTLSNQCTSNTEGLALANTRIDNIASLPSGSTSGDAELMDIRVGADGITYATAGDSVRSQLDTKLNLYGQPYTLLKSGDDLNTLDYGSYVCQNTNIAKQLLNCPVELSFRLDIFEARFIKLQILTQDYGQNTYIRKIKGATFYPWRQIITNEGVETSILNNLHFEQGGIDNVGINSTYASSARIRTRNILLSGDNIYISLNNTDYPNASCEVFYYDVNGNFIEHNYWHNELYIEKGKYFRVLLTLDRTSTSASYNVNTTLNNTHISNQVNNNNGKVKLVSHQGNVVATTNQCKIDGYIDAGKSGFTACEGDLRFTSDNIPVLCHDASFVDATSGQTIIIANNTLSQLKNCDYYGGKIATLEEVVIVCKKYGMELILDQILGGWTTTQYNNIFDIIYKYNFRDDVIFMSYYAEGLKKVLSIDDKVRVMAGQPYGETSINTALNNANETKAQYPNANIMLCLGMQLGESVIADGLKNIKDYKINIYRCDDYDSKQTFSKYCEYLTTNNTPSLFNK